MGVGCLGLAGVVVVPLLHLWERVGREGGARDWETAPRGEEEGPPSSNFYLPMGLEGAKGHSTMTYHTILGRILGRAAGLPPAQ